MVLRPAANAGPATGAALPNPDIPSAPDVPRIPVPWTVLENGTPRQPIFPVTSSPTGSFSGDPGSLWSAIGQQGPEVLSGPLPAYPELLRQAGIQGHVVLEAVVDTTGHVRLESILVISATNPAFVAAARHALLATLFRPAMIGGQPVCMRVRVPFEFTLRGDTKRVR